MNTAHLRLFMLAVTAWTSMVCSVDPISLPSYFQVCRRTDLKFRECATRNGQRIIPSIVNGDPSLGIPVMDPMDVEKMDLHLDGISFSLWDVKISGARNAVLKYFTVDFNKQILWFSLLLPKATVDGQYRLNGEMEGFPLEGEGAFTLTLDNVVEAFSIPYELVTKKDAAQYMIIQHANNTKLETSMVHIHMDNLFGGNQQLGDIINEALNENWRDLLKEFSPAFEDVTSKAIIKLLRFLENTPYNVLFPK